MTSATEQYGGQKEFENCNGEGFLPGQSKEKDCQVQIPRILAQDKSQTIDYVYDKK